jgi:hypothetical protein
VFVRFVPHNDRHNHRAMQGTRSGWLIVLVVPLDFRNDYDITNTVAAFGKFHSWHQHDIIKERTLIHATFDSPALVPRDYSAVDGVKETWTAPVYILGANFAEQLPADEDQMPLDGNPHPLPGNLMPQDNFFVLPQYPELGWHNAPLHDHEQQGNQHEVQDVQENDIPYQQAEEEIVDDSIVPDPSGLASPLADHGMEVDQPVYNHVIHLGMVRLSLGQWFLLQCNASNYLMLFCHLCLLLTSPNHQGFGHYRQGRYLIVFGLMLLICRRVCSTQCRT